MNIALSVLDLAPVPTGSSAAEAARRTVDLARLADRLGYARLWYAEHHSMASVASSYPEILIAHAAAATRRIRLGSGGIMLPNHAPLRVAEAFHTLEALYPGRIDLGLGRAPGSEPAASQALRAFGGEQFSAHLNEMLALSRGDQSEIVATVLGPHRLVTHMRLGDRAPLHATSGGKGLLAFMPEAERESYLERVPLLPITDNTIVDRERLRAELSRVRETSFAYVNSEFTVGIRGIATAVADAAGVVLGALTIAIPEVRFSSEVRTTCENSLRAARARIEARLPGCS